jgi:hypothetical protein
MSQLGYDTTNNLFYLNNVPRGTTITAAETTIPGATTTIAGAG